MYKSDNNLRKALSSVMTLSDIEPVNNMEENITEPRGLTPTSPFKVVLDL